RAETEELIGFFIDTLALRTNLSGGPTFQELLARVKETAVGAYAHQDLPFEKLVEELQPERDLNRNPFFQMMFQFQNASRAALELNGLTISQLDVLTETSKFDLMLAAVEEEDVLTFVMEYSTDLFEGETILRLLRQLSTLLEAIVASPDKRISCLPLMSEAERHLILSDWNTTRAEYPRKRCIHQLFEDQVKRTPDVVAVVFGSDRVTYAELNARANQLAHYLLRLGVAPETRVAICVDRSIEMIVGLLGILKAGGVYVPLEPTHPKERLSFMIEDSQAQLVLTQNYLLQSLPTLDALVVALDADAHEIARQERENPSVTIAAENAAHVIYTSGSTGRPKGVVSAHRSSVNRFAWMWREYPFAPGEVCCQKTSLSFVDSIWEIFGPLLQGVPLVIIPDEIVKDPSRFVQVLAEQKVTRLVLVPSLLRLLLERGDALEARLASLQYCVCSGETLTVELANAFRGQLTSAKLINLYGSSEVAADVTCYEVEGAEGLSSVPIGRPIANTRVFVLDRHCQLTAIGVPGEIFIGGEGLARGYLNRPDLTAERFIPDAAATRPGARLFRTGDLGRYLSDGSVEYRGRRDHQVKIRGFRIELGEIEAALATHPNVRHSVVVAFEDERSEKRLVAYVVADGGQPTVGELRAHLHETLPDYMVPTAFVMLDSLPLTASGKVDRLGLPKVEQSSLAATEDFLAPRTPTEDLLANIWAGVLNCDAVGINDDFFSVGGHSLLLARIASRIYDVFALELPLRTLFEAPTVAAMAAKVEAARRAGDGITELPIVALPRAGGLPLSFAQERLWFFDQLEPGSAAYNIPRALRINGPLNVNALQSSLNAIVARHEVLRSRFFTNNGRPVLSIAGCETIEIPTVDLRQSPVEEREQKALELTSEETRVPFDLARGPLLRLALARLDEEDHLLVLTMHHIVSDGWSIGVFLRELISLYNAFASGNSPELPELPVQYVDFAAWQRKSLGEGEGAGSEALRKQLEYWRTQLAGAPALIDLPTDRPRPPIRSFRGAKHPMTISKETTDGLKELARAERVTVFMTLLTAFQMLLSSFNGQEDVVVGSPTAGRNRRETESLIGYFVNTLVLRTKLSGDPSFRVALGRTREVALGAYANQDVPFEKIVEELQPGRTLSHNPLFQVWFALQNAPSESSEWQGLEVRSGNVESVTTRHDLQLTLWEAAKRIEGTFTYSTDLFDADTIACIGQQFTNLLEMVVADPGFRRSVLRTRLDEVGREFRQRVAKRLEEVSHQKLRSVKRRSVSDKL
ncbi:MAG TPA: amino acid adenylation domain-containing protein, partial [Pyrinomonadaceae bacterium]|nr:amino acid adenylation domain-containing protein [Pyrinomonadaceae bacterium]